jgi:RND family efflux transporter MFP subunit
MKSWNHWLPLAVCAAIAGCADDHGHEHAPAGHDHGHAQEGDLPGSTVTHFTRADVDGTETELFVEFGPLIVGEETSFAAHLTDCGTLWTAVDSGNLVVELASGGAPETFTAPGPSVPGIFRPVARPKTAGKRTLKLRLERGERVHVHDVGEVTVFPSKEAAEQALGHAHDDDDGSISFLKEQAWKLDFALAEVKQELLSPTVRVFGELQPRSDGLARVSASASGRLVAGAGGLPTVGDVVVRGAVLAHLVPTVSGGGNLAAILLQKEKATLAVGVANRELTRMKGLVEQGAIPARRVQDAESALARAQAELAGANRLLAQHQGTVSGGRAPGGVKIVAPISGVLTEVPVVAGSHVEGGETLFTIVDTSVLWLAARVPEARRARASRVFGGAYRAGNDVWRRIPPSVEGYQPSAVLDPKDRSFPLRIPIENASGALAAGTHVTVDLSVAAPEQALAFPASAVVYEQGVPVVYVMTEGESFERRIVELGGEVGPRVIAAGGVEAGERVVSVGAMYVKLAAAGGAAPGHGHAH